MKSSHTLPTHENKYTEGKEINENADAVGNEADTCLMKTKKDWQTIVSSAGQVVQRHFQQVWRIQGGCRYAEISCQLQWHNNYGSKEISMSYLWKIYWRRKKPLVWWKFSCSSFCDGSKNATLLLTVYGEATLKLS